MNYDFDTFVPRRGTDCEKWDLPAEDGVLPLWVADMDFRAAPAIVDALRREEKGATYLRINLACSRTTLLEALERTASFINGLKRK